MVAWVVWDALVKGLEGKVDMGIDIVDLVDIIRGFGITPVVKAFLNSYFAAISDLACT